MNDQSSPEFEKEIRETFSAPSADPAFVHDLRASLLERSNMKKQNRSFYRLAWGLGATILLFGLLAASPRVVEALKQLLGYVPGLGSVEQGSSLRLLTAPVTLEKNGLKATIVKGAADSERTIVLGAFDGHASDNELDCVASPRLVLSDGTVLRETHHEGERITGGSYYERYVFEAMPAGQLDVTLEIPCAISASEFTDFALPLHFDVATDGQAMPVIDLPVKSDEGESTVEGFSIVIENATPLTDGYILSGSYEWTDSRFEVFSVHIGDVEILDANGQKVTFRPADPGRLMDPTAKKLPFAYQIDGKNHAYPLTLKVNSMAVDLFTGSTFEFDAGSNPQAGQTWDVNIDVPVDEHIIHIQAIKLMAGDTPTQLGFTFSMSSDPAVLGARIDDTDPAIAGPSEGGGGGGGSAGRNAGSFESGWVIDGYSPAGLKTFVVSNITVVLDGAWQSTWQPAGQ